MNIICSDLEGVFVPEIWINVSKQTGIDELKLTTRDISDYDLLMKRRLEILREHNFTLDQIQEVISRIDPLPGALDFLNWLRSEMQVIIVSDTFKEFAGPLMKKMGYPTIFCHSLITDSNGIIAYYNLRQKNAKKRVVESLQGLSYNVIGIGDSYNDLAMLRKADKGILFNPPTNIREENNDLPVAYSYDDLKRIISANSIKD